MGGPARREVSRKIGLRLSGILCSAKSENLSENWTTARCMSRSYEIEMTRMIIVRVINSDVSEKSFLMGFVTVTLHASLQHKIFSRARYLLTIKQDLFEMCRNQCSTFIKLV